jgi:hypothetical protein
MAVFMSRERRTSRWRLVVNCSAMVTPSGLSAALSAASASLASHSMAASDTPR